MYYSINNCFLSRNVTRNDIFLSLLLVSNLLYNILILRGVLESINQFYMRDIYVMKIGLHKRKSFKLS